jgi:murein biosynthesis integral membrane protein MurJ
MVKNRGAAETVSLMMIIMLAGKALGLVRDSLTGSYFGTSSIEGTAFNYASVIPRQFMDVMFASAISASFIPVFNGQLTKHGKEKAFASAHNFISVILAASAVFTALCIAFSPQIIKIYDGGKTPEAIPLAASLIRIMFVIIILSCAAFSLTGVLQSLGEFNAPAAMGLASNGVILLYFIFFMDKFGVFGLCVAYVLGWAAQIVIQLPFLIKSRFGFRFHINLRDPSLRQIGALMLPVMASTWVGPVNILVNGKAALTDVHGMEAFNAITYANTLYTVISGVFVLSLANVLFPKLSVLASQNDDQSFGETLSAAVRALFFFLIPMSAGLMALAMPIVQAVYERGRFDALSTRLTSDALVYFSVGICGFGLQTIMTRGFYATHDGKTPMITSTIAIAVNLVLSYALIKPLGAGGPAAASSVSITIAGVIMLLVLNKRYMNILNMALIKDLAKMLLIGGVTFAVVYGLRTVLKPVVGPMIANLLLSLVVPTVAGCAAYFILALVFGIPEAKIGLQTAKRLMAKYRKP